MAATRSPQRTEQHRPVASHVLVPLDGSERSARALPVAAVLAEQLHATISVVDCVPPMFPTSPEERWVADHVVALDGQLVEPEVHSTTDVVGDVLSTADATPGTVVCLSSHGRSGISEVVLGSVARELILESPAPVLVVGPAAKVPTSFSTLQVSYDGSADSAPTLDVAAAWAQSLGATPWITHVVGEADLSDVSAPGDVAVDAVVFRAAKVLQAAGLEPEWDVLHGRHVADSLASWAEGHGTDLLVVGCHARPVVDRLVGTVTTRLLHVAPCPVLVVGPKVTAG